MGGIQRQYHWILYIARIILSESARIRIILWHSLVWNKDRGSHFQQEMAAISEKDEKKTSCCASYKSVWISLIVVQVYIVFGACIFYSLDLATLIMRKADVDTRFTIPQYIALYQGRKLNNHYSIFPGVFFTKALKCEEVQCQSSLRTLSPNSSPKCYYMTTPWGMVATITLNRQIKYASCGFISVG